MDKKELYKRFNQQWKEKNQTKSTVMMICNIVSGVMLIFILFEALMNMDVLRYGLQSNEQATHMMVMMVLMIVPYGIECAIGIEKNKAWKAYLEKHKK